MHYHWRRVIMLLRRCPRVWGWLSDFLLVPRNGEEFLTCHWIPSTDLNLVEVESPVLIFVKLVTRDKSILEKTTFRIGLLDLKVPLTLLLCIFDLKSITIRQIWWWKAKEVNTTGNKNGWKLEVEGACTVREFCKFELLRWTTLWDS